MSHESHEWTRICAPVFVHPSSFRLHHFPQGFDIQNLILDGGGVVALGFVEAGGERVGSAGLGEQPGSSSAKPPGRINARQLSFKVGGHLTYCKPKVGIA